MYKVLSVAESKIRKMEKYTKDKAEPRITITLLKRDGTVWYKWQLPPRSEWKYKS